MLIVPAVKSVILALTFTKFPVKLYALCEDSVVYVCKVPLAVPAGSTNVTSNQSVSTGVSTKLACIVILPVNPVNCQLTVCNPSL